MRRMFLFLVLGTAVATVFFVLTIEHAQAHCQIPCGIYDHHARIHEIHEHVATIEKSVRQMQELAGKSDPQSAQQFVRWVDNKEKHAQSIQDIVSQYFLAQVVKPVDPGDAEAYDDYLKSLADHHAVIVWAMKAKQNADLSTIQSLRSAVEKLEAHYPKK